MVRNLCHLHVYPVGPADLVDERKIARRIFWPETQTQLRAKDLYHTRPIGLGRFSVLLIILLL